MQDSEKTIQLGIPSIVNGGLYEIWIDEAKEPQPVIVIGPIWDMCFDVLVDGRRETIPQERIFEIGTARRPDVLTV